MSIWDDFNTKAEKKLANYLDDVDYEALTSSDDVTNLVYSLYHFGKPELAKTISTYWVNEGYLPFNRDSDLPISTSYDNAISPYADLKLIETISNFSETEFTSFIADRLAKFNAGMIVNSGDFSTIPLSTGVLLYDSSDNLLTTFRSGTYISDINPYSWDLMSESDIAEDMTDFIILNQDSTKGDFSVDGLLKPFYVRDLIENSSYGTYNSFVFDGFLSNNTSFYHQYESIMNISKFYFNRFKATGKKEAYSGEMLKKFLNAIIELGAYPTEFSLEALTVDSSTITVDSSSITVDQTQLATLIYGTQNIGFLARLGIAFMNAFKVDKDKAYYSKAIEIYDILISLQNADGTINQSSIIVSDQALCLNFFSTVNNYHYKTYYDMCNSALKMYNMDYIGDFNSSIHPQNYVLRHLQEIIYEMLDEKFYDFEYASKDLEYSSGKSEYNLSSSDVDFHRINSVEFVDGLRLNKLMLTNYQTLLEKQLSISDESQPQFYAINKNELHLYPTPDKDYEIKVVYFDETREIPDYNCINKLIPIEMYDIFKYYLCWQIGIETENIILQEYKSQFVKWRGIFYMVESNDISDKKLMPRKVNFVV